MTDQATTSDVKAAIDAGIQYARAEERVTWLEIEGEQIPLAVVPAGMSATVIKSALDLADDRAPAPRTLRGIAVHLELASFIAHTNRFKDTGSAVFADPTKVKLQTVFDYHHGVVADGEKRQRWGRHRATYECPLSRQWKIWTEAADKWMTQDAFADFIDANIADLAAPPPGAPIGTDVATPSGLLTMARQLQILSRGTFERTVNPTTGERR